MTDREFTPPDERLSPDLEVVSAQRKDLTDDDLKIRLIPCQTTAEWLQIAHDFERKWHFPQCIGGVDGKHFAINAPTGEGSVYYNHKFFHSIIGLAWVDANYKLIFFDVGSPGRCSDAGVYNSSPVAAKVRSGQAVTRGQRDS
ncbi:hypothetical protein QR680_006551 [Steinernema hermaphroditum]|uniref:DDE Tnp4 domain-containing protein n=1 Tax=Steinernema hermaphroditum TaxID=289476 RepID=A0AA39LXB6_9BILA|nr:hypothetical protein QR680_006551 [Steinernema hermaphroditum]